jgi:hypothetical protein
MALLPCLFGEPITTTRSMRCSDWGLVRSQIFGGCAPNCSHCLENP